MAHFGHPRKWYVKVDWVEAKIIFPLLAENYALALGFSGLGFGPNFRVFCILSYMQVTYIKRKLKSFRN